MSELFTRKNIVPLLIIFLLLYGTFSYVFHFFLSIIATHVIILTLAVSGCIAFKKEIMKIKVGKYFTWLYGYNILLFMVGFFFITDSLYMSFYISFFCMMLVFSSFYYFATYPANTMSMLGVIIKYVLPIYATVLILNYIFMPFGQMYDRYYLSFFPMLYLFLPFVSKRQLLICLALSLIVIMREPDFRALILLNLFGIFIYIINAYECKFSKRFLRLLTYIFFTLPIVLLFLSITIGLNPFRLLDDSIFSSFSLGNETIKMAGDSRSYFYSEIYNHLCKYKALLWGTTPGIGYETSLANAGDDYYDMLKVGRIDTEVGILEFFHYGGLINVTLLFIFFLVFVKEVFKKSKNRFSYVVCVYVAFRWGFLFMEGDIIMYMQWIGLFIVVGLFCNHNMLNMTDDELKATMKYYFRKRFN